MHCALTSELIVFTLDASQEPDYYALLSVSQVASAAEIKLAYHRALLLSHPDKQRATLPNDVDIGLLKRAYSVLSSEELRKKYDASRMQVSTGPRPAQIVSLEEFGETQNSDESVWTYACRCGGQYIIKESEMENDRHLVGCTGCSEVVWVGYELADDE